MVVHSELPKTPDTRLLRVICDPVWGGCGKDLGMIAALLVAAYLCGSVPFGLVVAKMRRVDLRKVGSGNIGATNAARALGKGMGALVLLLDAGKAAGPICVALRLVPEGPWKPWWVSAVALCAFLGHLYPVFAGFAGGKGVATALGCFAVLSPVAAGLGAATFVVVFGVTRMASVGSLVAVLLFPVWLVLCGSGPAVLCLSGVLLLFILVRHRDNIRRLWNKNEQRF